MKSAMSKKGILRSIFYVAILAFVSCSPIRKYQNDPGVLSWEKDIKAFEELDKEQSDPQGAILFTGSSSIRLWDNIHEDMKPYEVIQRGYGGAHFTDFAVYSNRIIYPHNPKAVVIFVANDITGGENDKTPQEVLKLYKYVVKQTRKKLPNEPIFFIQITPNNSRWKVWDKATEANSLIKSYSEKDPNLHYIETAYAFLGEDGKPKSELFREDQLHLNLDGYKIWSGIIMENLNKALK